MWYKTNKSFTKLNLDIALYSLNHQCYYWYFMKDHRSDRLVKQHCNSQFL